MGDERTALLQIFQYKTFMAKSSGNLQKVSHSRQLRHATAIKLNSRNFLTCIIVVVTKSKQAGLQFLSIKFKYAMVIDENSTMTRFSSFMTEASSQYTMFILQLIGALVVLRKRETCP
jgi:hypothetical protein